jgi:2'-5' RNA ligase
MHETKILGEEKEKKSSKDVPNGTKHGAGEVVGYDSERVGYDSEDGLPIIRRKSVARANEPSPKPAREDSPDGKRDILHASKDRAELVQEARDEAPSLKEGLEAVADKVPGAEVNAVRAEKSPKRLDEKIKREGQPVETIPDILAGRLAVDSDEAHREAADTIKQHATVVRDEDNFKKGDSRFGYRAHKLQVQVSPKMSAEVHIVPAETAAQDDRQHPVYKQAREAELNGETEQADALAEKAKAMNDAAKSRFDRRNKEKEQKPELKHKLGTTQIDLHPDSDAHKAILAMQAKIPKEHLANDGADEEADKPHVTVRYGVKDAGKIPDYLSKQKPFEAKLGKTIAFPPSEHSDGASPIVAPVESKDLRRMNGEIEKHGQFAPSSFPDYKPHVTVAYVKPEHADKYTGMSDGEGKSFPVTHVSLGDREGNKQAVKLGGSEGHKVGDRVTLPNGKLATVAYAPAKDSQLPTYRFRGDDGTTTTMRASEAHARVKKAPDDVKGTVLVKAAFTQRAPPLGTRNSAILGRLLPRLRPPR